MKKLTQIEIAYHKVEWLVQGERQERKRILKLLKPYTKHSELCKYGCYPEDCSVFVYRHVIELIKGGQK